MLLQIDGVDDIEISGLALDVLEAPAILGEVVQK